MYSPTEITHMKMNHLNEITMLFPDSTILNVLSRSLQQQAKPLSHSRGWASTPEEQADGETASWYNMDTNSALD